jgi:hypothetical protein
VKTSELTGPLLDYWVAKAEGKKAHIRTWHDDSKSCRVTEYKEYDYSPSTDWAQGGPIIERERIQSRFVQSGYFIGVQFENKWLCNYPGGVSEIGDTQLIAAMRCYVASKFGEEVPDETLA